MHEWAEVLVIGGGPAGSTAATLEAPERPVEGHPHHGLGGHGTSHMVTLPTSPDRAVEGLYLTTTPQLGLRQLKPCQSGR
jgi:hypothetical protein